MRVGVSCAGVMWAASSAARRLGARVVEQLQQVHHLSQQAAVPPLGSSGAKRATRGPPTSAHRGPSTPREGPGVPQPSPRP